MAELIRDAFEPVTFVVEESNDIVDGQNVLGKLKGEFFVPDGVSRNKRFYSKEVWEKQLQNGDIKQKLADRRMYGTIGHQIKVDDESLAKGLLSHITTDLAIDSKGKGVGEALILGTPTGRILNTVLRAGSKLYVSSRADGDYRGTSHGVPSVDPDKFKLEGFDFVLEPGFLQANPTLVESLQRDMKEYFELVEGKLEVKTDKEVKILEVKKEEENNIDMEEIIMSKELIEALTKEKLILSDDLTRSLKELEAVKQEKVSLNSEVSVLKQQSKDADEKIKKVEMYEKLGSPEDIDKALDLSEKTIWKYAQSGSPDEVAQALDKAYEELKKYRELGSPKDISEAFDKAESLILKYRELGTLAELNEALDTATRMFRKFQELGSPSEISLALDEAGKLAKGIKADRFKKRVESLAAELGVPVDKIGNIAKKMSNNEVRDFVKSLTESNKLKDKYLVRRDPKKVEKEGDKKESKKSAIFGKSKGQTLMEQFSR